jgi:hypothetical protein
MKRTLFLTWMGLIILGIITTTLLDSVHYITTDSTDVDYDMDIYGTRGTRGEPWMINTTRIFDNEDHTLDRDIIIYESGSFTIKEATLTIVQSYDYEYKIVVKDSGKLILQNGTIESNYAIKVFVNNFGNLKMSDRSYLKVNDLEADGNTVLTISNSEISNADNDLKVNLLEFSNLEMRQRAKIRSATFAGEGSSSILLDNSNIIADSFIVNCSKVNIMNNNNIINFEVDSCLDFTISNSNVEELTISNCRTVTIEGSTTVIDSRIEIATEVDIRNSQVTNLSVSYCTTQLLISQSIVEGLRGFDCEAVKITNNSKILDSEITTCEDLTISDIFDLDSLHIDHCDDSVSIIRSTINSLKVFAPYMYMDRSTIACTKDELDVLTKSGTFYATDTTFYQGLNFTGNTKAHLININPDQVMPKIQVTQNAEAYIFWWLTINVIDNASNPLEGVEVNLYDFFTDQLENSSVTNDDGVVQFAVLSNVIDKDGPKNAENKSYYYEGVYGNFKTVDSRSTRMDHNRNRELIFGDSISDAEEEDEEDEQTFEMYLGLIIILILIIAILGALAGRSSGGSKHKEPPEDEGDRRPYPPRGGRRVPPRRSPPRRYR